MSGQHLLWRHVTKNKKKKKKDTQWQYQKSADMSKKKAKKEEWGCKKTQTSLKSLATLTNTSRFFPMIYMQYEKSLQKHVRGADLTATIADRRRTYGDRKIRSAIDRQMLQIFVVKTVPVQPEMQDLLSASRRVFFFLSTVENMSTLPTVRRPSSTVGGTYGGWKIRSAVDCQRYKFLQCCRCTWLRLRNLRNRRKPTIGSQWTGRTNGLTCVC
jgi:hypothetical protein